MNLLENVHSRYRYSIILLRELVITDFKLRYQGSALGYLWSLLRPLALFAVLYFVFVRFLRVGATVPHYAIYLLLGIVFWNFFVETTSGSVGAITSRGDLIRKINFPKYVIILATSCSALINLGLNFVIIFLFMVIFGSSPSLSAIIVVPLLVVELYIFGIAVACFLSAANVKYRDIGYIWEVVIQAAFYATPILYPVKLLPKLAQKIVMISPVAQIVQEARYQLVTTKAQTVYATFANPLLRLLPFLIVVVMLGIGAAYFRANSKSFAEEV